MIPILTKSATLKYAGMVQAAALVARPASGVIFSARLAMKMNAKASRPTVMKLVRFTRSSPILGFSSGWGLCNAVSLVERGRSTQAFRLTRRTIANFVPALDY